MDVGAAAEGNRAVERNVIGQPAAERLDDLVIDASPFEEGGERAEARLAFVLENCDAQAHRASRERAGLLKAVGADPRGSAG